MTNYMPVFSYKSACVDVDPDIFFPEDNKDRQSLQVAKSICDTCMNFEKCLDYAVSSPELDGIWAGTTKRMRDRIRLRRNRKHR